MAVQVHFMDSLKFFLSLYGHKLPVLSMDISTDSSLLISGSADKNIKIWGLDFGDCHRSLFAHADSIMQARTSVPWVAYRSHILGVPCTSQSIPCRALSGTVPKVSTLCSQQRPEPEAERDCPLNA